MPHRQFAPTHLMKMWVLLAAYLMLRILLPSLIYLYQSLIFNCTLALPIIFRLYHALWTSWYLSPAPSHAILPTLPLILLLTWCVWLLSLTHTATCLEVHRHDDVIRSVLSSFLYHTQPPACFVLPLVNNFRQLTTLITSFCVC